MIKLINPEKPVLVEINNNDDTNTVLDFLSARGAFLAGTVRAPHPLKDMFDEYYVAHKTVPQWFLVTSPVCDDKADGLTVYFCDTTERKALERRLGSFIEITASKAKTLVN